MEQPKVGRERFIWESCDALWVEFQDIKRLTTQRIMDKLVALGYKRGSCTGIGDYKRNWAIARNILSVDDQCAPVEASDLLHQAMDQVYKQMCAETQKVLHHERAQFEETLQALLAEKQALQRDHELTEKEIDKQAKEYSQLLAQHDQTKENLTRSISEHQFLLIQYDNLQEAMTQFKTQSELILNKTMDEKNERIDKLEKAHDVLVDKTAREVSEIREKSEAQRHQWMLDLDQIKTQYHKEQVLCSSVENKLANVTVDLKNTEQTVTRLEEQLLCAKAQSEKTRTQLIDVEKNQATILAEQAVIQQQMMAEREEKGKLYQKLLDTQQKTGALLCENALLQEQCQKYNQETKAREKA